MHVPDAHATQIDLETITNYFCGPRGLGGGGGDWEG